MPAFSLQRQVLRVPDRGVLRLGVVADTHSAPHPRTLEELRALAPDALLHAGDIGALTVLDALRSVAPLMVVRGNIDPHAPELPDAVVLDVEQNAQRVRLFLTHIAVAGVKLRADVAKRARAEQASWVVCGHSHVPFIGEDRGLGIFNPGSVGPRRFSLPIVFGVLEVSASGVDAWHVDCERGGRWLPG